MAAEKLCRLRCGDKACTSGFAICKASRENDEYSFLPRGIKAGSLEEALDCARSAPQRSDGMAQLLADGVARLTTSCTNASAVPSVTCAGVNRSNRHPIRVAVLYFSRSLAKPPGLL